MAKIKSILRKIVPPIIYDLVGRPSSEPAPVDRIIWSGPVESWDKVVQDQGGYDQSQILERCKNALLKVKNNEAAYERDSVLFDQIQYSWPLLAALQKVALENGNKLAVLDFGGSLGSSYFQNRSFLKTIEELSWSIVEQEHFVNCGKEHFQNSELKFYPTIDGCLEHTKIDLFLLSGVLQYLKDPIEFFEKILKYKFKYIVVDRTTFIEDGDSKIMVQSVPESIYSATYPCWFISAPRLKSLFIESYTIVAEFESSNDGPAQVINGIPVGWKGFILEAKS